MRKQRVCQSLNYDSEFLLVIQNLQVNHSPGFGRKETQRSPVVFLSFVFQGSQQNSGFLIRRFLASNTLQTMIDYLTSEGYPSQEYKILSSWPRRDVRNFLLF